MSVALRDARKRDWFWGERAASTRLETAAQRSVYMALLELDRGMGLVWASQETIADAAKVSVSTVGRVLPDLVRLGLLQRASDETVADLSDQLRQYPAAVVYELTNVQAEPVQRAAVEKDTRPLAERLATANTPKATVTTVSKWLAENVGKTSWPWVHRMYQQAETVAGPQGARNVLARAAETTLRARPAGDPLAYMNRLVLQYAKDSLAVVAPPVDLSTQTEEAFAWEE